jgi:signal peptidase
MSPAKHKSIKPIIWRFVLLALVSLVIGTRFYSWNSRNLMGNEMPMPFGYGISVVLSGSMEPTLGVNELVVIHATDDVALGDVIVYQSGSSLIIHRVISIDGDSLVTQGDANNVPDPAIDRSAVKGVMVAHVPSLGGLIRILKQPAMTVALIALAVVLFELSYRRERKADNEELEAIKEEIRRLKAQQEKELRGETTNGENQQKH